MQRGASPIWFSVWVEWFLFGVRLAFRRWGEAVGILQVASFLAAYCGDDQKSLMSSDRPSKKENIMTTQNQGRNDAEQNKPRPNQNGWTTAQRDNYEKGRAAGKG